VGSLTQQERDELNQLFSSFHRKTSILKKAKNFQIVAISGLKSTKFINFPYLCIKRRKI